MMRTAAGLLVLGVLASFASAGPRGVEICTLSGRLSVARGDEDVYTLRLVTDGPGGYPELIVATTLEPGRFRVRCPRTGGEVLAVITSRHHQPVGWTFEADRDRRTLRNSIIPEPWLEGTMRVLEGAAAVEGADIRWATLVASRRSLGLPWLTSTGRSGPRGIVSLRVARTGLIVEATKGELWGVESTTGIETVEGRERVLLTAPRRAFTIRLWEDVNGDRMDARRLRVTALTEDGERWVPHEVQGKRSQETFRGTMPSSARAVRVEYPGCRPVLALARLGAFPDEYEACPRPVGSDARTGPADARLTISLVRRLGPEDPTPIPLPCGNSALLPAPGVRGTIQPMRDDEAPARVLRPAHGRVGDLFEFVPAGEHEVVVRGVLGLPRRERFDLPVGTDVLALMSVAGGSGVRLIVRGPDGTALERVSFRVRDGGGGRAACEYEQIGLRERDPWRFPGPDFADVPNAGLVRLEPGDYRIEILEGERVTATYLLTAWPDVMTRLDTAFAVGE